MKAIKNRNVITNSEYGMLLINRNDNVIGRCIGEEGGWETTYINFLKDLIRTFYPKNNLITIIDAGANIGIYSLSMAIIDEFKIKVIAIEAQRLIFQMLNANVALNNLDNVYTHHAVLCDVVGKEFLLECPNLNFPANYGAYEVDKSLLNSDYDGVNFMPPESVKSITLDSLGVENCALIKLDIEGMEYQALAGCVNLIKKSRPIIFFERHKTKYEEVKSMLNECEYDLWEFPDYNVLAVGKERNFEMNHYEKVKF